MSETQEQAQPQVEKQPKPISPEQYLKNLEKYHRQTKLECEIAEYQFRRLMALNQTAQFREQAATQYADSQKPNQEAENPEPPLVKEESNSSEVKKED